MKLSFSGGGQLTKLNNKKNILAGQGRGFLLRQKDDKTLRRQVDKFVTS